ncbi:MAG: hypothetical protein A2104_02525 [Candidatus Melainabacteria bacterium GWF2_32_7]|nr:MAG: hypothetical protein A2104_02525 [Candidatus Melainabacteria bacterium GWF2_32_7]OGI23300.1 MAG: hypothetical protein A2255_09560 [Candidatus Melainabacteria bacterium RIFOXYA2_FULL_32_9]
MRICGKKILGLMISIFFITLIIHQIDIKKSLDSFNNINLTLFPLIIPIYYLAFLMRALRWKVILSNDSSLKIRSLISSIFIGFTANSFLPARMGEFYRAHLFGKKENIKRAKVFASIVIERVFDGSVLFFILLSLIFFLYSKPWLFKLAFAVGIIFIGSFCFLLIFSKLRKSSLFRENFILISLKTLFNNILNKFPENIQKGIFYTINKVDYLLSSFLDGLDIFHYPGLLIKAVLLTFLIWLCEGTVVFIIIKGFGININFLSAVFVLCVTAFSTMIPAGPASIGPYQWGYILALGVFGITKELAFAVSIVNQFIAVSLVSSGGFFFIWRDHINFKEIENNIKIEEEPEKVF